jgi:HD-GYP domain-containing protein (c-di-GMP phosphodiesterase class II)
LHPLARLLAISDVFDALTSARPYRPAMPVEQATQMLRTLSGTHLAPEVVEPFLQVVGRVGSRHDDSHGFRRNASATGRAVVGAGRS